MTDEQLNEELGLNPMTTHLAQGKPVPLMSKSERATRIWCAWAILHNPGNLPDCAHDRDGDNVLNEIIDNILEGTGVESWDIFGDWAINEKLYT